MTESTIILMPIRTPLPLAHRKYSTITRVVKLVFITLLLSASATLAAESVVKTGPLVVADTPKPPSKVLHLVATNFPPFYSESLQDYGGVAQVVIQAFERQGYQVELKFYPFIRATLLVKTGQADGIIGLWYRKEREQWASYSRPIQATEVILLKRKDMPINYQGIQSLRPYTIGISRGYANPLAITQAKLTTEEATSDSTNLKKLYLKRIELALMCRNVAQYWIEQGGEKYQNRFEQLGPALSVEVFHFGASKQIENHLQLIEDFNAGLSQLSKDGTLLTLLSQYHSPN